MPHPTNRPGGIPRPFASSARLGDGLFPPLLQNPHRFDGDLAILPYCRKMFTIMSIKLKQIPSGRANTPYLGVHSNVKVARALQLLSPGNQERHLSTFVNKLSFGFFGNNSKTRYDLRHYHVNLQHPKSARQMKNKPISFDSSLFAQVIFPQQLNGIRKEAGRQ